MPDVVKHAHTHRPRFMGGTDPVWTGLPYAFLHNDGISQSVTTTAELHFSVGGTNSPEIFKWDQSGDPDGLLIYQGGIYLGGVTVTYQTGDIADPRSIYLTHGFQSSGPLGSVGSGWGDGTFKIGDGQGSAGVATVTSGGIAKSNLSYFAIGGVSPASTTDPARMATILVHSGTNYTVENLVSAMYFVQISDYSRADALPAPPP